MEQYIGRHDILNEIEDARVQIQNIYWIRAMLRETAIAYKKDSGYYTSNSNNIIVDWDPLVLYYVYFLIHSFLEIPPFYQ